MNYARIKLFVIFLMLLFVNFIPVNAQETENFLPVGVETYLINDFTDYKLYGLDHIKDLPKYNTESLTEFHMPIVYKIPSNIKLDIKKFIKQGLFSNTNKNFNDRIIDSGYTIYGNITSNEYFAVDYWLKVKASDKPFSVDFVPIIELDNKNYKLEKYAWWNSSYLLMKQITINHSYIDNNLVNFPVLVYNNDTTMLSKMDGGNSLRFTNLASDTEYNFEIEYFDDTNEMVVWVNVTSISSSVDTVFNMYYNNTNAVDGQDSDNTWNTGYDAVWHMDELDESTSRDNDLVKTNNPVLATGKIGKGYDFEQGDTDYFTFPDNTITKVEPCTVEMWINDEDAVTGTYAGLFYPKGDFNFMLLYRKTWATANDCIQLTINDGVWVSVNSADGSVGDNWHYIVGRVNNSDTMTLLLDGIQVGSVGGLGVPTIQTDTNYLGSYSGGTAVWDGMIDEVRYSNVYRDSSWIKASFHLMNQTTGFLTFGSESEYTVCPDITYSNEVPVNGATDVNGLISNLSVTINISFGTTFNYTIHCSNGNTTTVNNSVNGTYQLNISGLQVDTLYYWYVNTTYNTTCGWENVTYNFTIKKGCECLAELTEILNKIKKTNKILEGDQIIEMDATQFVIMVQLFLLCIFLWIGYTIPAMEGHKKSLHYMPFSGGLFIIFGGFDFISLAVLLTYNYELGIVGGFLTTVGIILLFYGILKAFYYELD